MKKKTLVGSITAALIALATLLFVSHEALTPRQQVVQLLNNARTSRNIGQVYLGPKFMQRRAQTHSQEMADAGYIFHSNLTRTVEGLTWTFAGENVGAGASILSVHRAFMASPEHRANYLQTRFDRVAVGVVRANGSVWITVVLWSHD
jgi:uncharacterized protein YkwD